MGLHHGQIGRRVAGTVGVAILGTVGVLLTASDTDAPPNEPLGEPVTDPEVPMPPPSADFEELTGPGPPGATTPVESTTRTMRLQGAGTSALAFTPVNADGRTTYTATGSFFGDVTGDWTEEGIEIYQDDVRSSGSGVGTAELTIAGVGTGVVITANEWTSDLEGHVLGRWTITAATGDLTGATGSMRWNSTDDVGSLAYQLELTVPAP